VVGADSGATDEATTGYSSYRARGIAARASRDVKRHPGVDELLPRWRAELEAIGWPVERLVAHLGSASTGQPALPFPMTEAEIDDLAAEVLDIDGRLLANHKVFTRTNLIAEVTPRLYGRDPAELDRVLDHLIGSRDVVPLIGVAGAREQAFTTAQILITEATIAYAVERLANRTGPALAQQAIAQALAAAESDRGHRLTTGQQRVVERLCGSGQAVSVVVGVAGSGKTTALDTAATALETAATGFSERPPAAWRPGPSAPKPASRPARSRRCSGVSTTARSPSARRRSSSWTRAAWLTTPTLARLVLAVERSGASLVLVGDHRQLAAVGPGGALAALLDRRPDLVVTLDGNVRQHDPAERKALADLRDGSVPRAVAWYARHDRIHVAPNRVDTLVAMTDAWAADVAAGHDTALLAWRRQDVADLNRLARQRWDQLGQLTGDDVKVVGGHHYAVGDRVVALAPNPDAGIVTSEPLTVLAAEEKGLTLRTSDGRAVRVTGEGVDAEHLDYGYAVTVHRAQGATYDRAHVLAAGGGRELGYVAMSRARDHTTIHATADDHAQAVEDLQADWGVARHQRWVTDTPARPGRHPIPERFRQARPLRGPDAPERSLVERRAAAQRRLIELHDDLEALLAGTGRWVDTPAGAAASAYDRANAALNEARRDATDPAATRRQRRAASKQLLALTATMDTAAEQWTAVGEPEADALRTDIRTTERQLRRLSTQAVREQLDNLPARAPERAVGLDRGRGL
jgi:hypothetical protein